MLFMHLVFAHLQTLIIWNSDLWCLRLPRPLQAASYQQEAGVLKLDNKRAQEDTQRMQEQIWTIGGPSDAKQPCCGGPSFQYCHSRGRSRSGQHGCHPSQHRTVHVFTCALDSCHHHRESCCPHHALCSVLSCCQFLQLVPSVGISSWFC